MVPVPAHPKLRSEVVRVPTTRGIALYSSTGAMLLEGPDAALLVDSLFPLLDGTHSVADLAGSTGLSSSDLDDLLGSLGNSGFVSEGPNSGQAPHCGEDGRLSLQRSAVTVTGAGPLSTMCAEALSAAGVGRVERAEIVGGDKPRGFAVGAFDENDLEAIFNFANSAHHAGTSYMTCIVGADEVIIGPLVVPGRSACWSCCYRRMRANGKSFNNPGSTAAADSDAVIRALLAREVSVALTAGEDRHSLEGQILVLDKESLEISRHRFLAVPGCEVCGGPKGVLSAAAGTGAAGLDQQELAAQALSLFCDSRTGIITNVFLEPAASTGLSLPHIASAIAADAPDLSGPARTMPIGWGKGLTREAAVIAAVGETIERYCGSMPDPSRMVWARPDELPGEVLDPSTFPLYTQEQYQRPGFPFVRFDPRVRHPWVAGEWLGSNHPVWVPAVLGYLYLEVRPEHAFCQGSSNGLAAYLDSAGAEERAFLELLERDAFMSCWRTRRGGERVLIDESLGPELELVIGGLRVLGAEIELMFLPTQCGYSTALCLGFGDGVDWPGVTLGLGTAAEPRSAARQAILELGQTGPYLRRLLKSKALPVPAKPEDVKEMLDHALYYFPAERAGAFDFLRHGAAPRSLAEVPTPTVRGAAEAGVRVAVVDVTSPDVAATSFRVMRAMSPDLQPISFGYGCDRVAVSRIAALDLAGASEIPPIW